MELTIFVIVLMFAIVLSNILDSAFSSFPLPVIQIGLGVLIALSPFEIAIELEPEIFMGVLIAPLLFREAEEADLASLWKVRKEVIFMVFGLVFATVFVIGFSVKFFVAALPLAACFCLGGILGPTDAIAVNSVSTRISVDPKVMNILKGEFLINDASGVIAFNFAALALMTGTFSVGQASLSFVLVCLGGVVVGLVVEAAKNYIVNLLKRAQIRNATAFMIVELIVPFLCFFLANAVGVSGIIAAVTAGTRQALSIRRLDIFEAKFAIVKKSLWNMISLVFNSFIFILLGLELPIILTDFYHDPNYSIGFAMKIGLLATGVMFAIRFIGVLIAAHELPGENKREVARNRIVLTLSGVKGTVSLATAFALPAVIAGGQVFKEERDLLLLVTACAIIYSLILATVLLPIIAKTRVRASRNDGRIAVLRSAIERIEQGGGEHKGAILIHMKQRLLELELEDHGERGVRRYRGIQNEYFNTEMRVLEQKAIAGEYTNEECAAYSRICAMAGGAYGESFFESYRKRVLTVFRLIGVKRPRKVAGAPSASALKPAEGSAEGSTDGLAEGLGLERIEEIFWENTGEVITALDEKFDGADAQLLSRVVEARIDAMNAIVKREYDSDAVAYFSEGYHRELKESYGVEREALAKLVREGRIGEEEADDIRVEINMLENFSIEEVQNDIAARLIASGAKLSRRAVRGKVVRKGRKK